MNDIGRIHVVRREGTTRFFDIRERAIPRALLSQASRIDQRDAGLALLNKYMRAYRIFDLGDSRFGWQRMTADDRRETVSRLVADGTVLPLTMDGVRRPYFMLAEDVDAVMEIETALAAGRIAKHNVQFLPPLDNLLWRRERLVDLFDYAYTWEVYTPAAKRQYGYYAMPILDDDKLIGRMDPRLDRDHGLLHIQLLQVEPEVRWTKTLRNRLFRALETFATFHDAKIGEIRNTDPIALV